MKRMWIGALALSMAMTIVGCGSETGGGSATVTKDAGTVTDTGSATDTGTTGGTDAGTTDTGSAKADTSTGTKDTSGGGGTSKCAANDNACLQACANKACTTELASCNQDPKCSGLTTCLNGCQQGIQPPKPTTAVSMPDGSTPTTCQDFCIVAAGDDGYKKLSTMQICVQGKCVKDVPGQTSDCVQGTANFNSCLNTCLTIKCNDEVTTCNNSKDCTGFLQCLNGCKGNQACQQGCQTKTSAIGLQEYQAVVGCAQSKCMAQP